jgi:hypothetical protein
MTALVELALPDEILSEDPPQELFTNLLRQADKIFNKFFDIRGLE